MKLTVIICTYNRSALLFKTLASINNALIPNQPTLSILVVANACSDDTLTTLTKYQQNQESDHLIPLKYHVEPNPGKSNALNAALSIISDGWLCFIDDDHRIDTNYFNKVVQSINQYPRTMIFCGRIIPDWKGDEPSWLLNRGKYKIYPFPIPDFEMGNTPCPVTIDTKLPGGGNLIVHSSVFNIVGTFSTELGPKGHSLEGSEDSDFILRAFDKNISIQYIPDIIQYHFVDKDRLKLAYLLKKSYERNRTLTLAKYPLKQAVPRYLWKKLFTFIFQAILSISLEQKRFYSVRIAAVLGEINGFRHSLKNN